MNTQESGQALPLGIVLLLAGVITAIVLFNTGQALNDKTRLANAADAAVYSGATWQARALNFNAYTNRAMVANQVAMAQAVSLQSWAQYVRVTTSNLGTVLGPVPIIGQFAQVVQRVMKAFEPIVNGFGNGILAVVDPINSALSKAQQTMYLSAFVASPTIIAKITAEHDPKMTWNSAYSLGQMGSHLLGWEKFTTQHEASDKNAMDERVAMINASTDRFTRDRSWEFFKSYLPVSPFTWLRVDRSGSTRLLRDDKTGKTEWKALDTLSLNSKFYYWFKKYKRVEAPIGYSMKFANDQKTSIEKCKGWFVKSCSDWFGRNKLSQKLARHVKHDLAGGKNKAKSEMTYRGVRAYRSLSAAIRNEESPKLFLRTELRFPINDIRDARSGNIAPSYVAGLESGAEEALSSISSAEIYFNKPNDDERQEYASGYNPYWAVRLAVTPSTTRAAALALRGSAGIAAAASGTLAVYGNETAGKLTQATTTLTRWSSSSEQHSSVNANQSGSDFSQTMTDVFKDVLARLFQGGLKGGNANAESSIDSVLAGVDVDAMTATVDDVNSEIDAMRQRYRAARESIRRDFDSAAQQLRGDIDAQRERINLEIAELDASMSQVDQEGRERLESEIRNLRLERDGNNGEGGLEDQYRQQLAQALVGSVKARLPEWPLPFSQALKTVDEYFALNTDIPTELNILEFPESEDDVNE